MTRAARIGGRVLWFAAAPLVCVLVFWRALFSWFLNDDFGWLALRLDVAHPADLGHALFSPAAQGTIRVLSERLFFLAFSWMFGLHALPYHLFVMLTWCAALTLAALVGTRLTGSRAAGLIAALLWTTSPNVTGPVNWASSYNEVLCSFCLLLAFYARLRSIETGRRGWIVLEWAAYLAGFGALELIVIYPALAALHALCFARKKLLSTLPLFIPAAIFTVAHLFFIPKNPGGYYNIVVDHRLPGTLYWYIKDAFAPTYLGNWARHGRRWGLATAGLAAAALLAFAIQRSKRREWLSVFCIGWFFLLLLPVLPLPNHLTDYYVMLPELGLAWLAGWALVCGWQAKPVTRAAVLLLAFAFAGESTLEAKRYTIWYQDRSLRIQTLVYGLRDAAAAHPDGAFLLAGVNDEWFHLGFQEDPFRLIGLQRVFLIPGSENAIHARDDLGGLTRWRISPGTALGLIDGGKAAVFQVSKSGLRDITGAYAAILRADPRSSLHDFVDVGDTAYSSQLGPTWYPAAHDFRWMPKTATVTLSGPQSASEKLYVTGYVPDAVIAPGPLTIQFRAAGVEIGSETLHSEGTFAFEFPIPAVLVGQKEIEITIENSRVLHIAGDVRDFGAVFGTFSIR